MQAVDRLSGIKATIANTFNFWGIQSIFELYLTLQAVRRGMQSAALLVVREGWGYGGQNDRYMDLRVADHAEPIAELRRLHDLHRKTFPRPKAAGK